MFKTCHVDFFLVKYRGVALKNLRQSCHVVILAITAIATINKIQLANQSNSGLAFLLIIDI